MVELPSLQGSARLLAVIVLVLLLLLVGSIFFATHFVTGTVNYVVSNIAARSGLSTFLVRGAVILLTIPFFWAVGKFTRNILGLFNLGWNPLSFYKSTPGIVIVIYIAAFYLAMYWASTSAYAYKYCGDTPEGIFVADGAGKDPVYGVETKPCSLVQIKELRAGNGNIAHPRSLSVDQPESYEWFDGLTGKARVFYAVLPNGDYRFFDRSGVDPGSGQPLQPITPQIVQQVRQQKTAAFEQKQRQAEAEASALKQKQAKNEQDAIRKNQVASIQAIVSQAENEFEAGQYKAAKQDCDHVVAQDRGSKECATIRQRSSVKLAQELVRRGQSQIQRGEFNEALWSAEEAMNLDPGNVNAVKLKELARQLKPHDLN